MPTRFEGGGGLNTRDVAPQVKNLTLIGGNGKIDVTFTGVDAEYLPLVKYYRVVAKIGGLPASPTDGTYVDLLVLLLPGVSASRGIKNCRLRTARITSCASHGAGGQCPLPHVPHPDKIVRFPTVDIGLLTVKRTIKSPPLLDAGNIVSPFQLGETTKQFSPEQSTFWGAAR